MEMDNGQWTLLDWTKYVFICCREFSLFMKEYLAIEDIGETIFLIFTLREPLLSIFKKFLSLPYLNLEYNMDIHHCDLNTFYTI